MHRLKPISLTIALLCSLLWPQMVCAGDWPFVHGPHANGHAPGERLLDQWPEAGPPVRWVRELGQGYSSFSVVGKRAVTQYQSSLGQYVLCLDWDTGETVWEHRYDVPYEALGIYPGPRVTPTQSAERVYFVSPDGLLGCLDARNGKRLWSVDLEAKFGSDGTGFGHSASPLLFDDKVILPVGGRGASIVAFDAMTGEVAWKSGSDTASYCPTIPISLAGHPVLVNVLENTLTFHDPSGRLLRRTSLSSGYDEHSCLALYHEPLLILAVPFKGGATAYRLTWQETAPERSAEAAREESGETVTAQPDTAGPRIKLDIAWSSPKFSNDVVSSIIYNGTIYGFDLKDPQSKAHRPSRGEFRALDLQTGEVLWSQPDLGQASMIAAGDKLLGFNDKGELWLLQADRSEPRILARTQVFQDEVCWTRPVLSDGRVVVRSHSRAVCLQVGVDPPQSLPPATMRISDLPQQRMTDWTWLLNGEREHPFMPAERDELTRWYHAGLLTAWLPGLLMWGLLAGVVRLIRRRPGSPVVSALCRWGLMGLAGIIATPLWNAWQKEFVLTWPVTLWATLQMAILGSVRVERDRTSRSKGWQSRGLGLLFLATGTVYFLILRFQSLPLEWVFLVGVVPALPVVLWSARQIEAGKRLWLSLLADPVGYSALFWGAVLFQQIRVSLL